MRKGAVEKELINCLLKSQLKSVVWALQAFIQHLLQHLLGTVLIFFVPIITTISWASYDNILKPYDKLGLLTQFVTWHLSIILLKAFLLQYCMWKLMLDFWVRDSQGKQKL
jgi:hypothetical protein